MGRSKGCPARLYRYHFNVTNRNISPISISLSSESVYAKTLYTNTRTSLIRKLMKQNSNEMNIHLIRNVDRSWFGNRDHSSQCRWQTIYHESIDPHVSSGNDARSYVSFLGRLCSPEMRHSLYLCRSYVQWSSYCGKSRWKILH